MGKEITVTKEQIDVYERVRNMQLKILVTSVFLILIIAILVVFIVLCFKENKNTEKVILGAIEGVMAYTAGPLAKHFFPALKATTRAKR